MMRRALTAGAPRPNVCQICQLLTSRQAHPTKRGLVTLSAPGIRVRIPQQSAPQFAAIRRLGKSTTAKPKEARFAKNTPENPVRRVKAERQAVTDFASLVAAIERVEKAFLAQPGIPSEKTTHDALRACAAQTNIEVLAEAEPRSELQSKTESYEENTTSHLLDLDDKKRTTGSRAAVASEPEKSSISLQDVVTKISDAAYTIITHPNVVITQRLLKEYVKIQARLGRPETLPEVLKLFCTKPDPREVGGVVKYTERNENNIQNAIRSEVADAALDAAIEAKDIYAAIGIVENTYATKPYLRSKFLSKVVIPGTAFATLPIGIWALASNLSLLQDSMDNGTATGIAFAGMLTYVAFTGTIGLVVIGTANDQMKRVTWLPGRPLRQRWAREEERAALDKVACAFGFAEETRWGEETGAEYKTLRQYVMSRGMLLDAVELQPGMN
jgi:hypothetical protein